MGKKDSNLLENDFDRNFQVNWPFCVLKCNLCALIAGSHGSLDKHERPKKIVVLKTFYSKMSDLLT